MTSLYWFMALFVGQTEDTLQWRHNGPDGVLNHQSHDCLFNCLFRRRSRKHQSSASLAFVQGIHRWPVNSPHKWPVTRKMFPLDDVIMSPISTGMSITPCSFEKETEIVWTEKWKSRKSLEKSNLWYYIHSPHDVMNLFSIQRTFGPPHARFP